MEETTAIQQDEFISEDVLYSSMTTEELLSEVCQNQTELLEEVRLQNDKLSELTEVCWWIFFILLAYGMYKIFLGNILSWFNGS